MQYIILTEFGIIISPDQKSIDIEQLDKETSKFHFSDPVKNFLAIKKREKNIKDMLVKFIHDSGIIIDRGIKINDLSLYEVLKKDFSENIQMMNEDEIREIQESKPEILVKIGVASNREQAIDRLRDFAIDLSSSEISKISASLDLHIIQAISSLDEIDNSINKQSARLKEWYGLHFPELDNMVDGIVGYAKTVLGGKKEDLDEKIFVDAGFSQSKVDMLTLISKKSRGGDITEENLAIVQGMAKQVLELYELRKMIEKQIDSEMSKIAPNLSAVLGTTIGARMIARAGSLEKLAMQPSSKIQILGAERALFRSLKTGSRPPKHGLLFQHSLVHSAPKWQRGKIARTIAAKAAIAARVDIHNKEGGGEGEVNTTLLDKLNLRVKEIEEKFKEPPTENEVVDMGRREGERRREKRNERYNADGYKHKKKKQKRHQSFKNKKRKKR